MSSLYITEAGSYLHKRGGYVEIGRNNEVLAQVPIEQVEDITLIDTVQISSILITEFLERNVPISWLSGSGKFFGSLTSSNTIDINKHKQQFDLLANSNFYFILAQKIISAKTRNQLILLRRYNRTVKSEEVFNLMVKIELLRKNIFKTDDEAKLMGYEGIISKLYFSGLGLLVPEDFKFVKRSKQPPKDPFNSMLSLGYSMLFNEILANIMVIGLHPYVGLGHSLKKGHPALVSDLIEEWRAVIVDSLVMSMVKKKMIKANMFTINKNGCFLNNEARKIFLQTYNKKLRTDNKYLSGNYTYRESLKKQCRQYAAALMQVNADLYTPMELR